MAFEFECPVHRRLVYSRGSQAGIAVLAQANQAPQSVLALLGLLALANAHSPQTAIGAATIWGLGVCFMWPTMLANVSERYPRGGELFIGLMGFAGAMAIQFVLPQLGAIFDRAKLEASGGEAAFAALQGDALEVVLRGAAATSFQTLAILPAILIVVFGAIVRWDRSHSREVAAWTQ